MSKFFDFQIDENSLKKFLKKFYQKIIDTSNFGTFENTLIEWIKNIYKNTKKFFELMKSHELSEIWFSSIVGFFYQHGIGCSVRQMT